MGGDHGLDQRDHVSAGKMMRLQIGKGNRHIGFIGNNQAIHAGHHIARVAPDEKYAFQLLGIEIINPGLHRGNPGTDDQLWAYLPQPHPEQAEKGHPRAAGQGLDPDFDETGHDQNRDQND